jgi:hypothetical protein
LQRLGRQAELLRTRIRTLGGALIDRSISAADAIGKTADKIGVGVEALQELRFAAKESGVEQQTLDMALQRFTRRGGGAGHRRGDRTRTAIEQHAAEIANLNELLQASAIDLTTYARGVEVTATSSSMCRCGSTPTTWP